ncbi:MAG TPA: SDR family NAD(P)-dependent oxidoreductase [Puia sp.]|nr:SDR family NAD(P)-dependent oxidoreductase [Puia sp.]
MNRKTILITGATEGIGKLAATDLASQFRDARILIHGRNKEKLETASEQIKEKTGNGNIQTYLADFSSLDEVRKMSTKMLTEHNSLDILINNAGAGFAAPRLGKDGTETRFTVNYLAPFLLTHLLLPALQKPVSSRIVNVASAGQSPIHFDDIMMDKNFDGVTAYTRSKLAIIMFTFDLAESLKTVTANCLHPGTYLDTGMVREAGIHPLGTAQSGADALVYLATSTALQDISGKYFNVKTEARANAQAYDVNARRKLEKIGLQLTKL